MFYNRNILNHGFKILYFHSISKTTKATSRTCKHACMIYLLACRALDTTLHWYQIGQAGVCDHYSPHIIMI
jgi:hypothetical protein